MEDWIKCSDRLPEATDATPQVTTDTESDVLLVYGPESWALETGFYCTDVASWYSLDGNYLDFDVTHWMPLPAPPE